MPDTFVKIATVTVGAGGAASMAFSSIPSTYTDLQLFVSGRSTYSGGGDASLYIATNLSGTYAERQLKGNGSSASSTSGSSSGISYGWINIDKSTDTANTFSNNSIYFPNYSGNANKSYSSDGVTENNSTTAIAGLVAGLISNTGTISSITLTTDGSYVQYSTATLYGISKS